MQDLHATPVAMLPACRNPGPASEVSVERDVLLDRRRPGRATAVLPSLSLGSLADPLATAFRVHARIAVRRLAHSRGRHTDVKTYMLPKVPAASHQNGASARSLWHHPDFLRLWAGQTISTVGSGITSSALPLTAVLLLGARATDMGWLLAAESAPVLVVGIFAGVWVDRFRRR